MKAFTSFRIVCALIIVGILALPIIYGVHVMRVPSLDPEEAKELIAADGEEVLLIDVRSKEEYTRFSLKDAVHISVDAISSEMQEPLREMLRNKKYIFVLCNLGYKGATATAVLQRLGYTQTYNIKGGLDAWLAGGKLGSREEDIVVRTPSGDANGVPRLKFTLFEQALICVAAYAVKPLYEVLSLTLIIMLWKSKEADLIPLRRAMIAFFLGENACAVNYLFFNEQSMLLEFLHIYGMLVCFGLASYAFMEAMDIRVFHITDKEKRCAILPLCKMCYKHYAISCNLRLLFLFTVPAMAVIACVPLSARLGSYFYVGNVFGTDVVFGHHLFQQILEVRLSPMVSLIFFAISFFMFIKNKEDGLEGAKVFLAAGLGPLGFSLMRFVAFWAFAYNPLWAEAWEEITEFIFIAFAFWIVLRTRRTKIIAGPSC